MDEVLHIIYQVTPFNPEIYLKSCELSNKMRKTLTIKLPILCLIKCNYRRIFSFYLSKADVELETLCRAVVSPSCRFGKAWPITAIMRRYPGQRTVLVLTRFLSISLSLAFVSGNNYFLNFLLSTFPDLRNVSSAFSDMDKFVVDIFTPSKKNALALPSDLSQTVKYWRESKSVKNDNLLVQASLNDVIIKKEERTKFVTFLLTNFHEPVIDSKVSDAWITQAFNSGQLSLVLRILSLSREMETLISLDALAVGLKKGDEELVNWIDNFADRIRALNPDRVNNVVLSRVLHHLDERRVRLAFKLQQKFLGQRFLSVFMVGVGATGDPLYVQMANNILGVEPRNVRLFLIGAVSRGHISLALQILEEMRIKPGDPQLEPILSGYNIWSKLGSRGDYLTVQWLVKNAKIVPGKEVLQNCLSLAALKNRSKFLEFVLTKVWPDVRVNIPDINFSVKTWEVLGVLMRVRPELKDSLLARADIRLYEIVYLYKTLPKAEMEQFLKDYERIGDLPLLGSKN